VTAEARRAKARHRIPDLRSRTGDLTPTQRELIDEFRARWGWSEEEARRRLKLAGG